jgi:membrane-associated phospholipid phosphatase
MIVSYVLKQIFDEPRPFTVFTELGIFDAVKTVPGYELRSWNSFPSGHTISAFGLFCMMAFFLKNNYLKILVMLVAVLVAYSRVYLMQHFYVDVYVGSMIGVAMATATYCVLDEAKWVKKLLKEK